MEGAGSTDGGPSDDLQQVELNGYNFKEGREYLVAAARVTDYAIREASYDIGAVSLCGGTRELSGAKEDLVDRGIGKKLR